MSLKNQKEEYFSNGKLKWLYSVHIHKGQGKLLIAFEFTRC